MKEKKLFEKILSIGEEVFSELGGGFNENVHQVGLAIEFREAQIKYLRETNIEIFYKNHPVGLDTPDFILFPDEKTYSISEPIILECKFSDKISLLSLISYFVRHSITYIFCTDLQKCLAGDPCPAGLI